MDRRFPLAILISSASIQPAARSAMAAPIRTVAFGLRLKQPRRIVQPLSAEQVAKFWASFRTFRDLAVVGLMLLDGLRSCEILAIQLEDLRLADALLHVLGKECHSYCISFRRRNETTIIHTYR